MSAAIEIQRGVSEHEWPGGERFEARMGLHVSESPDSSSILVDGDAQRTARVSGIAHGGQVLLSATATDLLADDLPAGASLRDLGSHRLKDLGRPESLSQLLASGLRDDFPPLRSLDNSELPNNLPTSLSPFVGRVEELAEVVDLLGSSRLVTLTGAGGSGKTRLALQAAAEILDGTGEGVWLVELASVNDPSNVPLAIAEDLELHVESGDSPIDTLTSTLQDQSMLIVLDNCEHLLDSVAKLANVFAMRCPNVTLLVTSREPLGADLERVYRVRSLSLPPEDTEEVIDLADSDAMQLFVTRSVRHDSAFRLDDENAHLAASVCRRLDGIPLAIELAAARHGSMSLDDLSRRLDERFRLLTGGSGNALPRQQTIGAMVAWTYDLLTDTERAVLRRLSVFVDGFDVEGAVAVCAPARVDASDIVGIVDSLVNKSLVGAERVSGTIWYSMLEVIRQFATERLLHEDGDAAASEARRLHAEYVLDLCETAAPFMLGGDRQIEWMRRLDREWGNLQAALSHFGWEPDGAEAIVRLAWSLGYYDLTRGHRQPYAALQSVLDRTRGGPKDLRCRGLLAWAKCAGIFDSDLPAVLEADVTATEEALALARKLGDRRLEIVAMFEQARALMLLERGDAALALAEECLLRAREYWNLGLIGRTHSLLGSVKGLRAAAQPHHLEALACFREVGDQVLECTELMLVAINGWENLDDVAEGRVALEEALQLAELLGSPGQLVYLWGNLAIACAILDEYEAAEEYCRRNLRAVRRLGMTKGFLTFDMLVMSRCAASRGDAGAAAQLAGASDAFWSAVARPAEFTLTPMELDLIARNNAELAGTLGEAEFHRLFAAGQQLSVDKAVDLALGRVPIAA